jgi:hypothetical protein
MYSGNLIFDTFKMNTLADKQVAALSLRFSFVLVAKFYIFLFSFAFGRKVRAFLFLLKRLDNWNSCSKCGGGPESKVKVE